MGYPKVSIVICSFGRPKELKYLIESLEDQTCQDYEVILCQEEGRLVDLKDKGWRKAKGECILFLDDDVVLNDRYIENVIRIFGVGDKIVGATGPTIVPDENKKNRDVFRRGFVPWLYRRIFLEGKAMLPGRITSWGANTIGANYETPHTKNWQYVDFLEPSAFVVPAWALRYCGGFDLGFEGVAEWCDVDLGYRLQFTGRRLLFHPGLKSWHFPIKDKAVYEKRLETASRYRNYVRFADRHLKRSFKNQIYRAFLKTYFMFKGRLF